MSSNIHIILTNLTRVCREYPARRSSLYKMLSRNIQAYAHPAIEVAQQHNGGDPIGQVLAECLEQSVSDDTWMDWLELYEVLPENSIALREVRLVVSRLILDTTQIKLDIKEPEDLPRDKQELYTEVSGSYASALADMGNYDVAIKYAFQCACYYHRYDPEGDTYLTSLQTLGECLMHLGQSTDHLLVQSEVTTGYYHLVQAEPNKYIVAYANALLVLSSYHNTQEQLDEAIHYASQAKMQIERIANPNQEHTYIAHRILGQLANCYEQIHQLDMAADLLGNNVKIIRDLYNDSPDRYALEFIDTLKNLAMIESRLGNRHNAEDFASEAIKEMAKYYAYRPSVFASQHASLLMNISLVDYSFNNLQKADAKMQQALEIVEQLYQRYPAHFTKNMAALYNNHVELLLAQHKQAEAIHAAHKSLCLYRSLKQTANIAMALNTLANARMQSGDTFRAQRGIRGAIKIYRKLSEENQIYLVELASTLGTLAAIQDQMEDFESSLSSAEEALSYWHNEPDYLKNAHPQQYLQVGRIRLACLFEMEQHDLAVSWAKDLLEHIHANEQLGVQQEASILSLYAANLSAMGHDEEAASVARQEVKALRTLPINEIPSYRVDLADALVNLCFVETNAQDDSALTSINEAVDLYRTLPEPLTPQMLINRSTALFNQASIASDIGETELAATSLEEALLDQRYLVGLEIFADTYPTDLLLSLQLLVNIYYQQEDDRFVVIAEELEGWLNQVPTAPEVEELQQQLARMQQSFTSQ